METKLKGTEIEVIISPYRPTVIIGDRINATLNERVANAVRQGDIALIRQEAISQVKDGANVININVRTAGVDEKKMLPIVVQAVAEVVNLPICIETEQAEALAAALESCPGKPLVNSISCKQSSLEELLPLVVQRGAAVIGVALSDGGSPRTTEERVEAAREVLRRSITAGVAREDIILDPLSCSIDEDSAAALTTLEAISQLARIEAVNLTLRPSSVSNGLPNGEAISNIFSVLAIGRGVTCPIIDPLTGREAVLIANLLLAKSEAKARYVGHLSQAITL